PGDQAQADPAQGAGNSASHDETQATGSVGNTAAKNQAQPGSDGPITTATTRIAAARDNDIWLRAVILAPSTSNSMLTTVLGDSDMTLMRSFFVKPQTTVAMNFSSDPQM